MSSHDATAADLLRDAYESIVNSHIYCIGIAALMKSEGMKEKGEFGRILSKHADVVGELEKFVKSIEGE